MIKCVVEFILDENNINDQEQFTYSLAEATEYLHSNGIIVDFHIREYTNMLQENEKPLEKQLQESSKAIGELYADNVILDRKINSFKVWLENFGTSAQPQSMMWQSGFNHALDSCKQKLKETFPENK